MSSEWTLEDAPDLHRARAIQDASRAVAHLVAGFQILHGNGLHFYLAHRQLMLADAWAGHAAECATRYRDAKRAVSELRNTLHDFDLFCRDLCGKDPVCHTFEHVMQDHADMVSEIDWEDDNDVCF